MNSNYALYIKEREGVDIIEEDSGFITYKHIPKRNELMVCDCFVIEEHRNKGIAKEWFDKITIIARELGCTSLVATTDPATKNWYIAEQAMINYGFGFEVHLIESGLNFYRKRI